MLVSDIIAPLITLITKVSKQELPKWHATITPTCELQSTREENK